MSFVYIAPLINKTAFKIGKSEDPINRIMSLTRFYDFDFKEISMINCENIARSYKIESLLHSVCESKRIIFEHDGGTDFFSYEIYDKLMSMINILIEINKFQTKRMPPIENIRNIQVIKNDDIEDLLISLSNKIRYKRLEYNISQGQMGKITGVDIKTIRRMEKRCAGTVPNFIRILRVLDLDGILSEFEVNMPQRQRATDFKRNKH